MKTVQTYTITVTTEDGMSHITRTNDGFNPLELAGIVSMIHSEIMEFVLHGKKMKVNSIERNVIVDKTKD